MTEQANGEDKETQPTQENNFRELGNECVRAGNFAEAIINYTRAIKEDPSVPQLFSNRSFAFLKLQHFYLALQDANEAIRLDPGWAKGYFRRGEVEFATNHFLEAMESYRLASQLQKDSTLLENVLKAGKEALRQSKADQQMPWLGAAGGLVLGILLVIADIFIADNPFFTNPIIQTVVVVLFSLAGLGAGRLYRWFVLSQRISLLEPPPDLFGDCSKNDNSDQQNSSPDEGEKRQHPRYNKAQARQRYKKGKL